MAANPMMSMAAAIAALNAGLALINAGSPPGKIKIYNGTPPVSLAASITGTLLSTLTFSSTSFPTAVDGGSNGLATASHSHGSLSQVFGKLCPSSTVFMVNRSRTGRQLLVFTRSSLASMVTGRLRPPTQLRWNWTACPRASQVL